MNLTCHISPVHHLNGTTTWTANWTVQETPTVTSIIITGYFSPQHAKAMMEHITAHFAHPPTSYVIHSS